MSLKALDLPQPDTDQPHQAGETQALPGGRIIYLSSKPLPTGHQALDLNGSIINLNETYLDVGGGYMDVFGWQLLTGVAFGLFLLFALVAPGILLSTMLDAPFELIWETLEFCFWIGVAGGGGVFLIMYSGHWTALKRLRNAPPYASTANTVKSVL